MTMLDDAQIADMIATVDASYPETVSVLRNTPTSDGAGGQTDNWAEAFTCISRRAGLNRGEEAVVATQLVGRTAYVVLLPAGTPVLQSDRFYFASDNLTLEILTFAHDTWELAHRCLCLQVVAQ